MRRFIGLAIIATMMACGLAARADETVVDPAKVSESLKAIFQFGSAETKKSLNTNTVTLISGTIGGTYVQCGADLASVLDYVAKAIASSKHSQSTIEARWSALSPTRWL